MPLALCKHNLDKDSCPPFQAGRTLNEVESALVWTWLHEDPACPNRVLLACCSH